MADPAPFEDAVQDLVGEVRKADPQVSDLISVVDGATVQWVDFVLAGKWNPYRSLARAIFRAVTSTTEVPRNPHDPPFLTQLPCCRRGYAWNCSCWVHLSSGEGRHPLQVTITLTVRLPSHPPPPQEDNSLMEVVAGALPAHLLVQSTLPSSLLCAHSLQGRVALRLSDSWPVPHSGMCYHVRYLRCC